MTSTIGELMEDARDIYHINHETSIDPTTRLYLKNCILRVVSTKPQVLLSIIGRPKLNQIKIM